MDYLYNQLNIQIELACYYVKKYISRSAPCTKYVRMKQYKNTISHEHCRNRKKKGTKIIIKNK